jgi:hypothetical protein
VDGFGVVRLTNARDGVIFRTGEKYFERARPNVEAADETEVNLRTASKMEGPREGMRSAVSLANVVETPSLVTVDEKRTCSGPSFSRFCIICAAIVDPCWFPLR